MTTVSRISGDYCGVTATRKTSAYIKLAYSNDEVAKRGPKAIDACNYILDMAQDLEGLAQKACQPDLAARLKLVLKAIEIERCGQQ